MFCSVTGAAVSGVDGRIIKVETDISDGLPSFDMVGLLNSEVREARERVRSALKNTGITIPPKRITINLSPAAIRKEGTGFDLPIAVGILCNIGIIQKENLKDYMFAGELGLNGTIEPVRGVLPMADAASKSKIPVCIIPFGNINEGKIVEDISVIGVKNLSEVIAIVNSGVIPESTEAAEENEVNDELPDFSDISGQESVIRAAHIAACGMHHFLMLGAPGAGKSMIAGRIPYILPKPGKDELIEITKIYSVSGKLKKDGIMTHRPYRAPHHTTTATALVGGGRRPHCGEISLAHKGVLFLDELTEFKSETIDALRQPLEEKSITITRIDGNYRFPADFMLVAAANRCKCGYYPDRTRCNCSDNDIKRYLSKISGPILDRMDICIGAPAVKPSDIGKKGRFTNKYLEETVEKTRKIQKERFKDCDILYNSQMNGNHISRYGRLSENAKEILAEAYERFKLSARSYYKTIKVARTIADMEEAYYIEDNHILEALGYRLDDAFNC